MDELTNIIHGALCIYCEYIGTAQCTDSIEIVCRSLMTAKTLNTDLNLTDSDLVILAHMRYNTNMNQIYASIIDSMILSNIVEYSRSNSTPYCHTLIEMDTDYSPNMMERHSNIIDTVKTLSAKNRNQSNKTDNPYERRSS